MKTRVKTNSTELVRVLLERNLSAKQAAQTVGIGVAHFSQLLQRDRAISYSVAARLKQTFGDRAVVVV